MSPARVLATVKAHRAIVNLHSGTDFQNNPGRHLCEDVLTFPEECRTLRALASIYAGEDGWREEWA